GTLCSVLSESCIVLRKLLKNICHFRATSSRLKEFSTTCCYNDIISPRNFQVLSLKIIRNVSKRLSVQVRSFLCDCQETPSTRAGVLEPNVRESFALENVF